MVSRQHRVGRSLDAEQEKGRGRGHVLLNLYSPKKSQKQLTLATRKSGSPRELTNSNSAVCAQPFQRKKIRRPFRLKLGKRRTRPDLKSGQAIFDHRDSTLDYGEKSHMGKRLTGLFQAVNLETRLEWFQLARALRKKGGQQYVPRDARVEYCRSC
jgi:hypothetical protein